MCKEVGSYLTKVDQNKRRKKARTNAWWSTFWRGDFSLEKSRKPKRRKKQELLLGRQPFEEGIFHWKNQETKKKKNKEIKQKLLLAAQPFREGTFHWKNQEKQEEEKQKKKQELLFGGQPFGEGTFQSRKPRRKKRKKTLNYCLVVNLLERGSQMF